MAPVWFCGQAATPLPRGVTSGKGPSLLGLCGGICKMGESHLMIIARDSLRYDEH